MKLLNTKLLLSFMVAICLVIASYSSAYAGVAPVITGEAIYAKDNRPIPGVWVRWTDSLGSVRYAQTDSSGKFTFEQWQKDEGAYQRAEMDRLIDINYDGVADTTQAVVRDGYDGRAFGCAEDPHTFTILPRPDMQGRFFSTSITLADMTNGEQVRFIGSFKYEPPESDLYCPSNIRVTNCDQDNRTATIEWNSAENANRYEFFLDRYPYQSEANYLNENGDASGTGNIVKLTQTVTLGDQYRFSIRSVRESDGQVFRSQSCSREFVCPGDDEDLVKPTATLTSCKVPSDQVYKYYLENINTYGFPFHESRIMMTFTLNSQTQQILNFLNDSSNGSSADYSQWSEQGREKREGDYFGFYLTTFNSLPANNTLTYQIRPDSRIGGKSMSAFRQYVLNTGLPTQYSIKANMTSRYGEQGRIFNSHIPANRRLDLSKDFGDACNTSNCVEGTCPVITITSPSASNPVVPVNNRITVTWSAVDAAPSTQYELIVYDRSVYSSPAQAYSAYLIGISDPEIMPQNLKFYKPSTTSQTVNFTQIPEMDPATWMFAVRATRTTCDANGGTEACNWVIPPQPPPGVGFPVTGKFYESDGNTCEAIPANEVALTGDVSVFNRNDIPRVTIGGTSYAMTLPKSDLPYILQLNLTGASADTYSCANLCGQDSTCRRPDVDEDNSTVHFFVKRDDLFTKSWWQVFGGNIFANDTINSPLPISETNNSWRVVRRIIASIAETAGIPITNRTSFGSDSAGWLSEREPQLQVSQANLDEAIKPNYQYYLEKLDLPASQLPDTVDQLSDLNGQANNGVIVHYRNGSITFAPEQTWGVTGNEHHVVLVNGNITFSSQNLSGGEERIVSVGVGSTVSFVASQNIIIAGDVGNVDTNTLTSNLAGIFSANQIIIQGGEDKRFIGEGSFFGWNGVLLQRQFSDDDLNATTPTETFIHRPDFVIRLPEIFRDTSVTWQEVN